MSLETEERERRHVLVELEEAESRDVDICESCKSNEGIDSFQCYLAFIN